MLNWDVCFVVPGRTYVRDLSMLPMNLRLHECSHICRPSMTVETIIDAIHHHIVVTILGLMVLEGSVVQEAVPVPCNEHGELCELSELDDHETPFDPLNFEYDAATARDESGRA
ncbi:hypothetical protein EVAR_41392_1 [Eumeta japonica]|uniref:Uncharacterized protein n=1 Tax=Eumeta variegata TaxID=151549 RepID=A0A4C1WXE0_EUMVA|nr:hypothetical protein EVAR_41392_1 [Eumeta japonica]